MSLFSKEFLTRQVESSAKAESLRQFPYTRNSSDSEKTPFDLVIENKVKYFDQNSGQLKELMKKIRLEISQKCFTKELNSSIPNDGKISECIREAESEYKKFDWLRETHFANIFNQHKKDLGNCPSHNNDCIKEADQRLVWNAAKLPYFFAENY